MLCNNFLFLTVVTSQGYSFQPEDELRKNSKYCTRYLFPRISGNESIRINLRVILLEVIRWPWSGPCSHHISYIYIYKCILCHSLYGYHERNKFELN